MWCQLSIETLKWSEDKKAKAEIVRLFAAKASSLLLSILQVNVSHQSSNSLIFSGRFSVFRSIFLLLLEPPNSRAKIERYSNNNSRPRCSNNGFNSSNGKHAHADKLAIFRPKQRRASIQSHFTIQ